MVAVSNRALCLCLHQDVKYAVKDDTLPDGSFIPKGGQILYSIYAVNRMEAFWGPDAADFRYDCKRNKRSPGRVATCHVAL